MQEELVESSEKLAICDEVDISPKLNIPNTQMTQM